MMVAREQERRVDGLTMGVRNALWRSAHLRWALYHLWSRLSGTPLLLAPRSPQAKLDAKLVTLAYQAQEIPAT